MSQTKAQLLAPVGIFTASGINVSGTLTATSYSGSGANLSGVGVGTTASVNTSGIITAVSFSGDGANLSGVGFGTADSAVTTGIVTASKFSGSGIGLTNIGGAIAGLVYSPSIGATSVSVGTNIEITFSKPIQAGVGTITLRTGSATGTIIESFDVASSNRLTINTAKLTIDPTSNLSGLTTYFVVIPSGTVKDTFAGISSNVGISSYSFTTQQLNYELYAWGYGPYGGLGLNDILHRSSPVQIPGTQWSLVWNNYLQTNAIKSDGTLWAWGYNVYGTLGQNDKISRSSPVQVPGTQWEDISGGYLTSIAKKTDGTLWGWGYNYAGALGLNETANSYYSSPVQVPGTQWGKIFTIGYTGYLSLVSKTDGTLWAWGYNNNGQLGLNNLTSYSSPIQIPGTQWNVTSKYTLANGSSYTVATKTDSTLWVWGNNQYGQLGQNNLTKYSSPVQVPGTQWDKVSTSSFATYATKTDGTLWAWGYNAQGQLGQNNTVDYSSPRQIPGTQWDKHNGQYFHTLAFKTDGTLWVWGQNVYGNLGQNSVTYYSSPVQLPGTQWYDILGGKVYNSFAIKQTT